MKILAVASLGGGAQALAPVIKQLRSKGVQVQAVSYKAGSAGFRASGIEPDKEFQRLPLHEDLRSTIRRFMPTSILTSANPLQEQTGRMTLEQRFWAAGKNQNIPTIAVLDSWGNYIERFVDLEVRANVGPKIRQGKGGPNYRVPQVIAVMDDIAKGELVRGGIGRLAQIEVTGSPYFAEVRAQFDAMGKKTRETLLKKPVFESFFPKGKLIVFISDSMAPFPDLGFTEKSVLQSFLSVVNELAKQGKAKFNVVVRPHPVRHQDAAEAFAIETPDISKVIHNPGMDRTDAANAYSLEELLFAADLVVGTWNTPLITARIAGRQVCMYLPGMDPKYRFFDEFSQANVMARAASEDDLRQAITDLLNKTRHLTQLQVIENATDRIIALLQ